MPYGELLSHTLLSLCGTFLLFSIQMWISFRFLIFMVGLSIAITGVLLNIALLPKGGTIWVSLDPWAIPAITIAPHTHIDAWRLRGRTSVDLC